MRDPFAWSTISAGHLVLMIIPLFLLHKADLLIANGAFPSPFPNIVGHEGSGKVVKVGKAVTRVKEGDSVLLSFSYDQKCKICKAGHPAACKVGSLNARQWLTDNLTKPDSLAISSAREYRPGQS